MNTNTYHLVHNSLIGHSNVQACKLLDFRNRQPRQLNRWIDLNDALDFIGRKDPVAQHFHELLHFGLLQCQPFIKFGGRTLLV